MSPVAPAVTDAPQQERRREANREAERVFGWSIVISGIRCALTYVLIPLLGPLAGMSESVGPWLGLALSAISAFFIVLSMRRFFRAKHRYRWHYATLAIGILILLAVQSAYDIASLMND